MAKTKSKLECELDGTEILRYLNECGLQPVTPRSIMVYLDDCLRPVSLESVQFQLRYLQDRKWVELCIEKRVGQPASVVWARINADGVDEYDRREQLLSGPR